MQRNRPWGWQVSESGDRYRSIRVMLLDGESAGPYHDWQHTTSVLKRELDETGLFTVAVVHAPQTADEAARFQPEFSKYQVVVSNYDAPDWPIPLRKQLERFVEGGDGFVVVHAADNAFPSWPEFNRMIGVGGWRGRTASAGPHWYVDNNKLTSDDVAGPAGSHGARLPFQVITRAPEHPIMKGLPLAWMHAPDAPASKFIEADLMKVGG